MGGGGHTAQILALGGSVLGIDCDQEAIDHTLEHLGNPINLRIVKSNFATLKDIAQTNDFIPVDGILFDLGVNSHQLTSPTRGLSFNSLAPLDMRLDQDLSVTARDLVAALGPNELKTIFVRFGNEPRAAQIAHAIVKERKTNPITTTDQLARLVEQVYGGSRVGRLHPATKVFQALRIAINDELNSLSTALPQAVELLNPTGRLVVISFHQGEDKIVKDFFNQHQQLISITQKPQTPSYQEIINNPRSRSAKLRIASKK